MKSKAIQQIVGLAILAGLSTSLLFSPQVAVAEAPPADIAFAMMMAMEGPCSSKFPKPMQSAKHALDHWAQSHPKGIAAIKGEKYGDHNLTYSEMARKLSARFAHSTPAMQMQTCKRLFFSNQ